MIVSDFSESLISIYTRTQSAGTQNGQRDGPIRLETDSFSRETDGRALLGAGIRLGEQPTKGARSCAGLLGAKPQETDERREE
jgi:hypothetical protein